MGTRTTRISSSTFGGTNAAKAMVQMEIFQHLSERPDGTAAIGATAAGPMDRTRAIAVNTNVAAPMDFCIKTYGHTKGCAAYGLPCSKQGPGRRTPWSVEKGSRT